jgi:mRNA interferase RelE/StbE
MHYSIKIESDAMKQLAQIDKPYRLLIVKRIDDLASDPFVGKQLKGQWRSLRRIRVGNYRVIYSIKANELVVLIVQIGHRKDIYS